MYSFLPISDVEIISTNSYANDTIKAQTNNIQLKILFIYMLCSQNNLRS